MSKSKSKYDDYEDNYNDNPYIRKSDYLNKKREKRLQKALKTKDIDGLLEQTDDYDDENNYPRR